MENIGAEVGQKMRSAIKAKLLELDCYVDDELPDYIMVMVANKRSKNQMTEDLNLFLSKKTSVFVNWLHIVLKKLKEVSVTNPEVYKSATKRKLTDNVDAKVKEQKIKPENDVKIENLCEKSLTDDLPISLTNFEQKTDRIVTIPILKEVNAITKQEQLEEIENRIRIVKNNLGDSVENVQLDLKRQIENLQVTTKQTQIANNYRTVELQDDSDISEGNNVNQISEDKNSDLIVEYTNTDEGSERLEGSQEKEEHPQKRKHSPVMYENAANKKRISALQRLGGESNNTQGEKRIRLSEFRKEEEKFLGYSCHLDSDKNEKANDRDTGFRDKDIPTNRNRSPYKKQIYNKKGGIFKSNKVNLKKSAKRSVLDRLGVMSKIHVPLKKDTIQYDEPDKREVRSEVQVKPRLIPADAPQPNKILLLKAMAEAQKSIVQAAKPKSSRVKELLRNESTVGESEEYSKSDKSKLRTKSHYNEVEVATNEIYIPKSLQKNSKGTLKYIPSLKSKSSDENNSDDDETECCLVDTIQRKNNESQIPSEGIFATKKSAKLRLQKRRSPSPIIFDKVKPKVATRTNITDNLSLVRTPFPLRIKERCKYWPSCRLGDQCEFVHPMTECETFPNCKFGDKCLYLHPVCKFGSACTKRNCHFSHKNISTSAGSRVFSHNSGERTPTRQTCKYLLNCANQTCPFYHPNPTKYRKYSKSSGESTSFRPVLYSKTNLTWSSK